MLSIKVVLVSACLASAVYGNPTFDLSGVKKVLGGAGKGLFGEISDGPIGTIIHAFFGAVDAKLATDADLIKNLLKLNIPAAFKDIFHFFDILDQTLSKIVGSVLPEFGVAFQGLSQTSTRIASCLLGGGFGNVDCIGLPRRHGKGPVDITKYSSQLGLDKNRKQVQALIRKIENRRGNLYGSEIVVISICKSWMSLLEKQDFGDHDFTKSMTYRITITATILNSRNAGSGATFAKSMCSIISPKFKEHGYADISLDDIMPKLKNTSDKCDCWSKTDQGNNGSIGQSSSRPERDEDKQGGVPCLD